MANSPCAFQPYYGSPASLPYHVANTPGPIQDHPDPLLAPIFDGNAWRGEAQNYIQLQAPNGGIVPVQGKQYDIIKLFEDNPTIASYEEEVERQSWEGSYTSSRTKYYISGSKPLSGVWSTEFDPETNGVRDVCYGVADLFRRHIENLGPYESSIAYKTNEYFDYSKFGFVQKSGAWVDPSNKRHLAYIANKNKKLNELENEISSRKGSNCAIS